MRMTGVNRYRPRDRIKQVQFTCRIYTELFDQMEKLCKTRDVSLNFMLNRIIKIGLTRML